MAMEGSQTDPEEISDCFRRYTFAMCTHLKLALGDRRFDSIDDGFYDRGHSKPQVVNPGFRCFLMRS
jgi:hypothetical protein